MRKRIKDSALSAGFVFLAGFALWPPGAVYWEALPAVVGTGLTLAIVVILATILGGTFTWATGIQVSSFVGGALAAYVGWMAVIELTMTPDSPVHYIWYGVLLTCMTAGVVLWNYRVRLTAHRVTA